MEVIENDVTRYRPVSRDRAMESKRCVCMCVGKRERERDRERGGEREDIEGERD